jgi:asparagine N-glycosylation enzyme membrane subunit Stt3
VKRPPRSASPIGRSVSEAAYLTELDGGPDAKKEDLMLWTIFLLLMIMWVLGMVTSYTLGGFIHILLVLALVSVLIRVIQGRNPI